ncbi:hypothetical protein AAHC03_01277 [Spirometra sp. Aus1]
MARTRSYYKSNADCGGPQQQTGQTPATASSSQTADASQCPTASETTCILDGIKNLLECSICRERFVQPRMLPCQHIFCATCIAKMTQRDTCPVCRKRFVPHRIRSCLLLNNLLELASKHPSLAAPREPSPPPAPRQATSTSGVDDQYTLYDSEYEDYEDDVYSDDDDVYSDDSYFPLEDESMAEYFIRTQLMSYDQFVLDNEGISDDDFEPPTTNTPSIRSPGQRDRPRPWRRNTRAANNGTTASNTNSNVVTAVVPSVFTSTVITSNSGNNRNRNRRLGARIFRRCPEWPLCPDPSHCDYMHPKNNCRNPRPCRYGDSCCFLHPEDLARLGTARI